MNIDELEKAFVAADTAAQNGDKQAAEDAAIFAAEIDKFYKAKQGNPGASVPAPSVSLKDIGQSALEAGKDVGRGALKSLSDLVALAAPGASFAPEGPSVAELTQAASEQNAVRQQMIQQAVPVPPGRGPERQALQSFLEGAGGVAAFPLPGGPVRQMVSGGLGNLASQQVAESGGSTGAQVAAALAAAALSGVPGTGAVRTPPLTRALQGATETVGPGGFRVAEQAATRASQALGTPVLLQQGLDDPTSFKALSEGLITDPATAGPMHQLLNAQGPAAIGKMRELISNVSPTIPGQREAQAVQEAAVREVSTRPDAMRATLTKKPYAKGARETFPLSVRFSSAQDVADVQKVMRVLENSDAGRGFLKKHSQMIENSSILQPNGKPFVKLAGEPMELENFRKELNDLQRAGAAEGAAGSDKTESAGFGKIVSAIDRLLEKNAPEIVRARELSSRAFRQKDALQKSALGKLAPGGKDELQQSAEWGQLTKVLQNSAEYSPADIVKLTTALHRSNPKAPGLLLRQHLESNLESALGSSGGRVPVEQPSKLADAVFGPYGSRQRANTLQMLETQAKLRGQDGVKVRRGAETLIDAMHIISRDKSALGGLNLREVERASQSALSKALRGAMWSAGKALSEGETSRMYEELFQVVSTPGGAKALEEIAGNSLAANRIRAAAATLRGAQPTGEGWSVN